jgi:uncharacterized protein Yka (UPF0111/DUF47 family)
VRLSLVPRRQDFYGLFAELGQNAYETAKLTLERFATFPDSNVDHGKVKDLEHEGDRLTGELYQLMNTQYVTPFDREDIQNLARAIDDVVDHAERASDLLGLYRVEAPMEQAIEQCQLLVGATEHLAAALGSLRNLRGVQRHIAGIKSREDEGDRVVRDAVAALFEDENVSPRLIIQWKDIFETLEDSLDACDTAGHLISNILVKNA